MQGDTKTVDSVRFDPLLPRWPPLTLTLTLTLTLLTLDWEFPKRATVQNRDLIVLNSNHWGV